MIFFLILTHSLLLLLYYDWMRLRVLKSYKWFWTILNQIALKRLSEINEVYTNCINTLAIIIIVNVMELKDKPTGKDQFFICAKKQTVQLLNVTSKPSTCKIGEDGKLNTVQKNCFFNPRSHSESPCIGEFYLSLNLYPNVILYETNQFIKQNGRKNT